MITCHTDMLHSICVFYMYCVCTIFGSDVTKSLITYKCTFNDGCISLTLNEKGNLESRWSTNQFQWSNKSLGSDTGKITSDTGKITSPYQYSHSTYNSVYLKKLCIS